MAKNKLYIEFANEKGVYPINVGTTFTDVFGETLDSASVIISKIPNKLNIKPNDEVRIYNEGGFIFGKQSLYYLIDTVYYKEITLNNAKQYQYTIELKSLTSYLDLVQLPNRTLNHSLVKGQKNIIDYIEQFVEIYAPKVKYTSGSSWRYKRLFDVDTNTEFIEKFSVPCRDLSFSQPTLRQALTSLMLQVGCLPKIEKSGELGDNLLTFLDLREPPKPFTDIDKSQNYTTGSLASDSYVNTLVGMSDNVLDDENVVITENIGFRDTSNVFLKQKENLFLNTIYPIYSVESLKIKYPVHTLTISYLSPFAYKIGFDSILATQNYNGVLTITTINTTPDVSVFSSFSNIIFSDDTRIYRYERGSDGAKLNTLTILELENKVVAANQTILSNTSNNYMYLVVGHISFTDSDGVRKTNEPIVLTSSVDGFTFGDYIVYVDDITMLCVEKNKRNLLNTNFVEMNNVESKEELAQYIYGTVSYDIGGKVIEGFSSTYSYAVAWWQVEKTYIEAIVNKLSDFNKELENYPEIYNAYLKDLPSFVNFKVGSFVPYKDNQVLSSLMFELTYKPLNTFRMNYIKEEEQNYRLEQLDTSENAITNFNDLLVVEQQKVNRLGNEVIVKNQRTQYISAINDLNTKFDDCIVFQRVVSVGIEDFKVNYTASKNYVLQNYFTAIQTKYRAYEYTSYGASVVRKENTTIFARIGRDYYDGDDNIYFGSKVDNKNKRLHYLFLSAAAGYFDNKYKYQCVGNGDRALLDTYKSDLSIMIGTNVIAFNTQAFDSVSYGIKLTDSATYDGAQGGIPQVWLSKNPYSEVEDDYNTISIVVLNDDGISTAFATDVKQEMLDYIKQNYDLPIIYNPDFTNAMFLVDNNKQASMLNVGKTYYLDKQEVLNTTIQFVFYTNENGIKWTEKLWKLCTFVSDKPKGNFYIYQGENDFEIIDTPYTSIDTSKIKPLTADCVDISNKILNIYWNKIGSFIAYTKVIYEENGTYYDLLAVERTGNNASDTIYITLNDTKTDKVAYNKNGLYSFNEYEVAKNTLNRTVKKL